METHDIPGTNWYWHVAWYTRRKHPFKALESTHELEDPFRIGVSWVYSVPGFKFAFVIGCWVAQHPDEETAILTATGGRILPEEEVLDLVSSSGDPTDWVPDGWTYEDRT